MNLPKNNMLTSKEIGKLFKDERERQNLTVDEACQRSRIHSNVIKDIESGIFDRIGKIYLKSFMKKYSSFLGMDTDKVMSEFDNIFSELPSKEFSLETDDKSDKDDTFKVKVSLDGKLRAYLLGILGAILVVIFFIFIFSSRSKSREKNVRIKDESNKYTVLSAERSEPVKNNNNNGVLLTLKATGEVWTQVRAEDGKVLFAGVLQKNETKTWNYPGNITVWTGKAENLDFTVNGDTLGVVSKGVVKNIEISKKGVRIGKTWVTRFE